MAVEAQRELYGILDSAGAVPYDLLVVILYEKYPKFYYLYLGIYKT